jgi:hypothetical protein
MLVERFITLPQPSWGHMKSLSPVWIKKCLFNLELSKNFCSIYTTVKHHNTSSEKGNSKMFKRIITFEC